MSGEDNAYPKSVSGQPVALEAREAATDGRRFSPSIGRNKEIVGTVFAELMPHTASVLEIASGTGEHGAHLTAQLPKLAWTYSDIDPESLSSQAAWRDNEGHGRLRGPLTLDVTVSNWAVPLQGQFEALFCANMIHIAPFEAAKGLLAGAGTLLPPRGRLMLYGPFGRDGEMAPSNAGFDQDLKRRNSDWGVRDLDLEIVPLGQESGLDLKSVTEMPANNLSVIFERRSP